MKKYLIALLLVASPAAAGSSTNSWDGIGTYKAVDALACFVYVIRAPGYTPQCHTVPSWDTSNINTYASECKFVFPFNGVKTVYRLEGSYDSQQHYTGNIWQTSPTCNTFLCSYVGRIEWYGRSVMSPQSYNYYWTDGYGAKCGVAKLPGSGQLAGDFYGSL